MIAASIAVAWMGIAQMGFFLCDTKASKNYYYWNGKLLQNKLLSLEFDHTLCSTIMTAYRSSHERAMAFFKPFFSPSYLYKLISIKNKFIIHKHNLTSNVAT